MKGGDFMEREALDRLQGLRESEVPHPAGYDSGIAPDQEVVEVGSDPMTHPLRRGRIRIPAALEIAETVDPPGQPK